MLDAWAARWAISPAAVAELRALMVGAPDATPAISGHSEAAVQAAVRLRAAHVGIRAWRNNVGALLDARGVPVRFGLANDSKAVNERVKSADLIGCKPVLIGPQHVGSVIGQFWSRECKEVGWKYRGDPHERAQLAWANIVTGLGGDAGFTTGSIDGPVNKPL